VQQVLSELFPTEEIIRIATHDFPTKSEKKLINSTSLAFLGGSNILNSTVNIYNNWKLDHSTAATLFSKKLNVITLGVGWGEYQSDPGIASRLFYRRRLSSKKLHSVRDSYTKEKLNKIAGIKSVNTGCPTTWNLNGADRNRLSGQNTTCVFTLTDYSPSPAEDEKMINVLMDNFQQLVFFPQGSRDLDYFTSLELYSKNKTKFTILEHDLGAFEQILGSAVTYVGTRLHAGIEAINKKMSSLIFSIDNRAIEMANDISLPVIERGNAVALQAWLNKEKVFSTDQVILPVETINTWKNQFR
jgi:polysaccharide pyruvyl transferase WcaK-like protein